MNMIESPVERSKETTGSTEPDDAGVSNTSAPADEKPAEKTPAEKRKDERAERDRKIELTEQARQKLGKFGIGYRGRTN